VPQRRGSTRNARSVFAVDANMHAKHSAPYGTWPSPITPEVLLAGSVTLSELSVDGDDVLWLEGRPADGGRTALVRLRPGEPVRDVLPPGSDVGSTVHEYGGGAYAAGDGLIVYSERSDGSVRLADALGVRTIAAVPGCRYAAFALDPQRLRVYAVREDHRDRPASEPENAIVVLSIAPDADPAANAGRLVAGGSDFVLAPQLSPDGTHLAWIAWDHPNLPWDATRLYAGRIAPDGTLEQPRCIAGEGGDEAIVEAHWMPGGTLVFASDRSNWWNLYAVRAGGIEALAPVEAEIGEPPWVFGRRAFVPLDDERIACAVNRGGVVRAGLIAGGALHDLPVGAVLTAPLPLGAGVVFIATPPDAPAAVARAPQLHEPIWGVIRSSASTALDPAGISVGVPETAPVGSGELTHFFWYPPAHADLVGPHGTLPPLIVMSHGGPTSVHTNAFALGIQWWTSRGFAVAHVNYRGSTGFGRAYRRRLLGDWGVADVEDCVAVARLLVETQRCDAARIAVRGASASGMTALLAATSDVFRAVVSLYGVMELEALAAETHKFESRYVDGLVGPLPAMRERYRERSPIAHAARISAPVLLFGGLDDRVVPPNQAEAMRDALAARGVPVTYIAFPGESHGFRKADTLRRVLNEELAFYRTAFGLPA
jgi:dipeptidyl aminopeptidase/acylaminoacyl peptidase